MVTSKALRLEGFGLDGLKVVEVEVAAPGPTEVQVELRAASLNYRDLMTVMGTYNPRMVLPRVIGSDAAGVVTAVGIR